jgi:hypothetical protein
MRCAFGTTVSVVVVALGIPATAHHSNALYFDVSKTITLEGAGPILQRRCSGHF